MLEDGKMRNSLDWRCEIDQHVGHQLDCCGAAILHIKI